MMKKLVTGAVATAAAAVAAAGAFAPSANADTFTICPDGRTGVATTMTSCEFAHNVRVAWYTQPGSEVMAYSPLTGYIYPMQCGNDFTATFSGANVNAVRCAGGDNAVVWIW